MLERRCEKLSADCRTWEQSARKSAADLVVEKARSNRQQAPSSPVSEALLQSWTVGELEAREQELARVRTRGARQLLRGRAQAAWTRAVMIQCLPAPGTSRHRAHAVPAQGV